MYTGGVGEERTVVGQTSTKIKPGCAIKRFLVFLEFSVVAMFVGDDFANISYLT